MPALSEKVRKSVLERDQHRCTRCGATGGRLEVHHIDGRGENVPAEERNNDPANLTSLCVSCHRTVSPKRPVQKTQSCVCRQCGRAFDRWQAWSNGDRTPRYCSRECLAASRRKQIGRVCERCGKTFEVLAARSTARWCSWECRVLAGKAGVETRTCSQCGGQFAFRPSTGGLGLYCSKSCATKARHAQGSLTRRRAQVS